MNEHHYAVVVGINRYPGISDLKFARKDAEDFCAWLKDAEGGDVPDGNIVLITALDHEIPPGARPTDAKPIFEQVENALSALEQRCINHCNAHPEDWQKSRLYFFASGHGIASDPNEAALLMANASREFYGRNFSCAKYLVFYQMAQPFKELVFFADCCRIHVGNAPIFGPTRTGVNKNNGEIITVRGFATIFGKRAFEPTSEEEATNPDQLRGYFTKALIEGLKGQARDPESGEINSRTLSDYVTDRVQALTKNRQKPYFPDSASIIFRSKDLPTVMRRTPTYQARILFPGDFAGQVELLDGEFKSMGFHEASASPWNIDLMNGLYKITRVDGASSFRNGGVFEIFGENCDVQL